LTYDEDEDHTPLVKPYGMECVFFLGMCYSGVVNIDCVHCNHGETTDGGTAVWEEGTRWPRQGNRKGAYII
jgi:hypothetical protein